MKLIISIFIVLSIGICQTTTYDYNTGTYKTTTKTSDNTWSTYDYNTSTYQNTTKNGNSYSTYDNKTGSYQNTTKTGNIYTTDKKSKLDVSIFDDDPE